jgi:ABC-type nitrate/sulfonate/bicarbonate transport system permease component
MWRTLWAFLGVMILAVALGTILGWGDYLEDFFTPFLMIALTLPAVAVAAAATLIFSFGDVAPIVTSIVIIFPYLTFNIWKAVENIDIDFIEMGRSFNLSRRRLFSRIVIRDIAPALFGSSRNAVAHCWRLVTLAEIFAASSGMGYKILQAYEAYQFSRVWAWVIVFIVIILLIEYVIFRPIAARMFSYRTEV